MSKAFTKDDAEPEALAESDPADLVTEGAVNYLTKASFDRFQTELAATTENGPRRRWLARLVEISRPIDPASLSGSVVRFGATVLLRGEDGAERTYQIVGIQETDATAGRISWNSPLARALLGKTVGDEVTLRSPAGESELEILGVEFRAIT